MGFAIILRKEKTDGRHAVENEDEDMKRPLIINMMVVAVTFVATSASATINSRSYVQGGLVAQYDGIDNVGIGQHGSSAATWVNLAGDSVLNGTVDSNVVWGDDGWSVSANCKPITVGNALSQVTGTGSFTLQFACKPDRGANSGRQCFFSQYAATDSFGIEHKGTDVPDCIRLYSAALGTSLSSRPSGILTNEWASITIASENGMKDVRFYKSLKAWGDRHFASAPRLNKSCPSVIGGEPNTGRDMAFRGKFNALRVYGRALTEEEVKINAAVDAIRFNGADWSDYPELADYSFAADGTLQFNLVAEATTGGTVRLDGGEAAANARAAYAYGSAVQTATFTAVADSGYVFYRWEGDLDSISEGSFITPTVTVTSSRAATLTAVFKSATHGVTSLSYVTRGLVALYDGKDNAGFNTHASNATTWTDLTGNGNDGTCASELSWGANGWSVSGNCKPVTLGYGISAVTATDAYTVQFACKPTRTSTRECFFSQYIGGVTGIGIEHNGAGSAGSLRFYSNAAGTSLYADSSPFRENEWVQGTITAATGSKYIGFWKNGVLLKDASFSNSLKHTNICYSVIGGEPNTGRDMAFRGTYNAFRLYDRVLTADEIAVNAAVDAIRFNGANASSYALSGGYSFAVDGTLMVDVSATATDGGKVKFRDGTAETSVADTLPQDGSVCAVFKAIADAGYMFQEWTGDVDAIINGSILTERIVVDSTRPVSLTAVFRKNGNALDGMVLDMEFSSDGVGFFQEVSNIKIGNALQAGAAQNSEAYDTLYTSWVSQYPAGTPQFLSENIALPSAPYTTNAAQKCVYFPQYEPSSTNVFAVRIESRNLCVTGPVASFYVRFRWEGSVRPASENWSTILMNGVYGKEGLKRKGQGFVLRLQAPGGTGRAYPDVFVPTTLQPDQDTGTDLYIEPNRWVDCFASVYPSSTDVELSNADIWFCQTPAVSNGTFGKPVLKHRHIGDEAGLPRMTTSSSIYNGIIMGSESSSELYSNNDIFKAFRGSIAAVKAWKRLLTEGEMRSVMVGRYGGTFNVGVPNGSADEFGASGVVEATFDPTAMAWQKMKKSLTAADRTLTLEVPLTAENAGLPRVLEIVPIFDGVGASCPVTVAANGATVGTFDLMDASKRAIVLRAGQVQRNASGKLVLTVSRPEGCAGTLSFDAISLGGSWQVGIDNNTSTDMGDDAKGTSIAYLMGDPTYLNAQRALTTSYRTLSLFFDVPKSSAGLHDYRYQVEIAGLWEGGIHTYPIHVELNGNTLWSSSALTLNQVVTLNLSAADVKSGLNEIKWSLDAEEAGSWVSFDYHKLKMLPPRLGTIVVVK